jgi:hypothetical protein
MNLVAGLALVLLTLVGYSGGSALGARGRTPVPGILDLLAIVALWVGALVTRGSLGKWTAILVWLVVGLLVGLILVTMRRDGYPEAAPLDTAGGLWNRWKVFASRMGNYQSRVLMALVYFTIVLPFGLGVALVGDPLGVKRGGTESNWQPKRLPGESSIEEARGQS